MPAEIEAALPMVAVWGPISEVVIRSGRLAAAGSKNAVTCLAESISTTHRFPERESHPCQLLNRKPGLGLAVRVRRVPEE